MTLSLSAAAITRRLRAAGHRVTSTTIKGADRVPAAVRVQCSDEDTARAAAALLMQDGYEVARSSSVHFRLTVVLPEPTEEVDLIDLATEPTVTPEEVAAVARGEVTVRDLGITLEGEDNQPCPVCALPALDFPADRPGWTCSDECAELYAEVGSIPVETETVGTFTVVVTANGPLGKVYPSHDGTAFVAAAHWWHGETLTDEDGCSIEYPTRHAAIRALYAAAREDDSAEPEFYDGDDSLPEVVSARMLSAEETAALSVPAPAGAAVETSYRCPACDQTIVVTLGDGEPYSECGGQGDGGCEAWCEGDPAAEQSHREAVASAVSLRDDLPDLFRAETLRPHLVEQLRALAARSLVKVTRLAATVERPSGEGAHQMFLLRAAHVAALADYAAKVVEGAGSLDLQATVETATATYLRTYSPGDETPVARAVRFAAGRVELATIQTLRGEPTPADPERLPETV